MRSGEWSVGFQKIKKIKKIWVLCNRLFFACLFEVRTTVNHCTRCPQPRRLIILPYCRYYIGPRGPAVLRSFAAAFLPEIIAARSPGPVLPGVSSTSAIYHPTLCRLAIRTVRGKITADTPSSIYLIKKKIKKFQISIDVFRRVRKTMNRSVYRWGRVEFLWSFQ